jgi:hypothetical protein
MIFMYRMFPLTPMYIDYFVLSIILPPLQARVQEVATRQSKVAATAHGLTRVRSSGRLRFVRLPEFRRISCPTLDLTTIQKVLISIVAPVPVFDPKLKPN